MAEPKQSAAPTRELTLQDIMDNLTRGFASVRGELGDLKRDTSEAKTLAAKATTLASETKDKVDSLEARVAALEEGGAPQTHTGDRSSFAPRGTGRPTPRATSSTRDWDKLGGEHGDTLVVGGFRRYADKEEREQEWNLASAKLPPHLREAVTEVIIPRSHCEVIILKVARSPKGVEETRTNMLAWTAKFKELGLQHKAADEEQMRTYYAQPSKPFEMRQRNAKTMAMLDGLKKIAGEEKAAHLKVELSKGRIIYNHTLLADRGTHEDMPSPQMSAIEKAFPGTTKEQLMACVKEVMDEKEKSRKGP